MTGTAGSGEPWLKTLRLVHGCVRFWNKGLLSKLASHRVSVDFSTACPTVNEPRISAVPRGTSGYGQALANSSRSARIWREHNSSFLPCISHARKFIDSSRAIARVFHMIHT